MSGRAALPPDPVAARSPLIWRFMGVYFARYVRRHLNAVRLAQWGRPPAPDRAVAGPVVVYSNHPAWWDAALIILLAQRFFPDDESYAPFDAAMLARYRIFARMGAFGVDLESPRGAAAFLAASRKVLERPGRVMWITAQGRFSDVRERPLALRPGVARLAELAPEALFVPLALDYAFWEERGAEACAAFGPGIPARDLLALPRPDRLARLEADLTATLDRLALDVRSRDPARFASLLDGRRGVGGVYEAWHRVSAALTGRRFVAGHREGRAP
ncbi:glycerol acyltransferase [Methylobacterium platani JCM 14648]|uniref:Glycerol acyltransferase n=3 Tax=Methylobacterium platani TaxID=427683 RepID=A0A179S555_9HYPH|nr:glycerol acyltransferase [Methylobacterium platani JCM 14648]OAS22228.1 glycerol acyltransferase [Methylobacterium platani]